MIVLRGGPVAAVNAKLRALGLPALTAGPKDEPTVDLPDLPGGLDEELEIEVPKPVALPTPKACG